MDSDDFEIVICSDIDYMDLIAEITHKGELCLLLHQERGFENLEIQIHMRSNGEPWSFALKEFEEVLAKAKQRLWGLRRTPQRESP